MKIPKTLEVENWGVEILQDGKTLRTTKRIKFVHKGYYAITTKEVFYSDGLSGPHLILAAARVGVLGKHLPAVVLHDWLFRHAGKVDSWWSDPNTCNEVNFSRRECNQLMNAAMRGSCVSWWMRTRIMVGLAIGSWIPWRKHTRRVKALRQCTLGEFGAAWKLAEKDSPDPNNPVNSWWLRKRENIKLAWRDSVAYNTQSQRQKT